MVPFTTTVNESIFCAVKRYWLIENLSCVDRLDPVSVNSVILPANDTSLTVITQSLAGVDPPNCVP